VVITLFDVAATAADGVPLSKCSGSNFALAMKRPSETSMSEFDPKPPVRLPNSSR
jgi:hypothetical protein